MAGRSNAIVFGRVFALLLLLSVPAQGEETPDKVDPVKLKLEADRAERDGKWEKALELNLKLLATSPTDQFETRRHIRQCVRNVAQDRRHIDPSFRQYVLTLTQPQSLDLYTEVVAKIAEHYADRTLADAGRLYAAGLDELDRALDNPEFRKLYLPDARDADIKLFQNDLRTTWKEHLPESTKEVRLAAREVAQKAKTVLGRRTVTAAIVLELICGACAGLDQYSLYLAPETTQSDVLAPILQLTRYGILVRFVDGTPIIEEVLPNSWAAHHTPFQKGDRVERVNQIAVAGLDVAGFSGALQNVTDGVTLEVAHGEGIQAPVKLPVAVPTVYGDSILDEKLGIGYLRLASFRETTVREFDAAINRLRDKGAKALIIDARGNCGGLFTSSVEIARKFLPNGIVVTTHGQAPEFANKVFQSTSGSTACDLPVVMLVDSHTMSAAEVLAVAWKENRRAVVVGMPTFGKGAVQSPIRLESLDKGRTCCSGVLVLTVATVRGPLGRDLSDAGVVPDLIVSDPAKQLEMARHKAQEVLLTRPAQ